MAASTCLLHPPSPISVFDSDGEVIDGSKKQLCAEDSAMTLMVFDWDDTLLPSSWLSSLGLRLDTPSEEISDNVRECLAAHSASVCALLGQALERGQVIIITNAEMNWVEFSAAHFMPSVVPFLDKMRVISARSTYEPEFPNDALEWKVQAFQHVVDNKFSKDQDGQQKTVISFGDSISEREAVLRVAAGMPNTYTKSIKFVERPDLEQLHRQVELVRGCLEYITTCQQNLDLMLTIQLLYN